MAMGYSTHIFVSVVYKHQAISSIFLYRIWRLTLRLFYVSQRDSRIIWVSLREDLILLKHANNKGVDQPVSAQSDQHLCYLLSGKYNTCRTSISWLGSVAEKLSIVAPKIRFSRDNQGPF